MRCVYVVTGHPVTKLESGFMVDSRGRTVGMDLWIEVKPNQWVPASQLPEGTLSALKDRGEMQHGIVYQGKLYTQLEISNTLHKLIAAKEGLEKAFKEKQAEIKDVATFKAQIGNPLDQLIKQLERVKQQIEELKTIEGQERQAALEALKARTKRLKRKATELQKQQPQEPLIKPEDVQPTEYDFLWDIVRGWQGKALSAQALELLAKAQRIGEYVDANHDLLLNPAKMAALRNMLMS